MHWSTMHTSVMMITSEHDLKMQIVFSYQMERLLFVGGIGNTLGKIACNGAQLLLGYTTSIRLRGK